MLLYRRSVLVGALVAFAASVAWTAARPSLAARGTPIAASQGGSMATLISVPYGIRLIIVLNGAGDFSNHRGVSEPVGGRWISLDLSVTNVGTQDFDLSASNFGILSGDAIVFSPSTDDTLPQPQFTSATLSSGQTIRGTVLFDVPVGQSLQSALFQAAGTTQFVIAPIGS